MKKVLVTGARGYLASLARLYNAGRMEFVCVSHTDVDFSRPDEVEKYFMAADFDVCLHMAADATTAHCEEQPELTHRVNTESAIAIAKAKRQGDAWLYQELYSCRTFTSSRQGGIR